MCIARALANSPRVILADKLPAALDRQTAAVVMILRHRVVADHAAAVLVVTRDDRIFARFICLIRFRDGPN